MGMEVDLSALVKDEDDSHSDSTATGTEQPPKHYPFRQMYEQMLLRILCVVDVTISASK